MEPQQGTNQNQSAAQSPQQNVQSAQDMQQNAQKLQETLQALIEGSNSIQILLPKNASFDDVAAGLSIYLVLKEMKDVSVVASGPMTVEFNRLVGVNRISEEGNNKNLIIAFADYKADDIERVSYDIEEGQFRLTVIPKSGILAPKKDQVIMTYTGSSSDIVILVGGETDSDFPTFTKEKYSNAKVLHVGTSKFNTQTGIKVMSVTEPAITTVSEMAFEFIKGVKGRVTPDVATNILMGMDEGSKNFTDPRMDADSFQAVAYLMKMGGKRSVDAKLNPESFPPGSIPGQVPHAAVKRGYDKKIEDVKKEQTQSQQHNQFSQDVTQGLWGDTKPTEEEVMGPVPEEWKQKPKVMQGGFKPKGQENQNQNGQNNFSNLKPGQGVSTK